MSRNAKRRAESEPRNCPLCSDSQVRLLLDLGETPLGDRYCETQSQALAQKADPLRVGACCTCNHVFLLDLPDIDETYMNYLFTTSSSPGLDSAFKALASELIRRHEVATDDLVLDIGANDGTWLLPFRDAGATVVAVEPAPMPATEARKAGIDVIQEYFSPVAVRDSGLVVQAPRLISLNFMFANVPDPLGLLSGVAELAGPDTVVSIMTGYHPAQLAVGMFDYVNHDHLSYFSCRDFLGLAEAVGLAVTRVAEVPLKGGSLHVEMQKTTAPDDAEIPALVVKRENWLDQPTDSQWNEIGVRIALASEQLRMDLLEARSHGRRIIGYGASISATSLIYAFGIESLLDELVDDNPLKQGRYSPGCGLLVSGSEVLREISDAVVVVVAWQHAPAIQARLNDIGFSGHVIVPFPSYGAA